VLKIIGLIGVILSLGLVGIMKSQQLRMRVMLLEDYMQMVLELKGQISYFKEPLPVIFSKIDKSRGSKSFELLSKASFSLEEKDAEIEKIWPRKVEENYKGLPLSKDDIEIFKYLGTFIGQTDYDNHLFHFSYLEEKLDEKLAESKNNLKVKGPMYRKIGFFLGAILAILLI